MKRTFLLLVLVASAGCVPKKVMWHAADLSHAIDAAALFRAADEAMYRAKDAGRNSTSVSD